MRTPASDMKCSAARWLIVPWPVVEKFAPPGFLRASAIRSRVDFTGRVGWAASRIGP